MKRLKLFFACLLMAVLSIGQVWAGSIEITSADITDYPSTAAYGTRNWTVGTIGGQAKVYGSSSSHASLQFNGSNRTLYNTTALPGRITSIVLTTASGTNRAWKVYGGTSAATSESTDTYGVQIGTSQTVTTTGTTYTVSSGDYTYFLCYLNASNASYIESVVVNYEDGGGSTPSVSLSPSSLNLDAENVENQSVTITTSNFASAISSVTTGLYSDAECATPITSGAWVKDITVNTAKTAVTFNVDDNETGAARECWLKVSATDGTGNASAAVHIAQKKIVVDYATLPFSFTGGKADIETTDGMTQSGLGSDYSATEKLKFDNTGDWLKIKINADPGKLSYQIKGNSFSGGTFTIQQSADDETYSNLATYTADGSVELALDKTTRYVKFIYTSKSSGNIGLGNIAISLPVDVEAPTISGVTPFLSSTEVTLTQNDADHIYYTTNGDAPTTGSTLYEGPFELNATATVKAIAIKDEVASAVAEKTFTKATILTPAEALAIINGWSSNQTSTEDYYVQGTISQIDEVNVNSFATYYISADGTTTDQLQVYKGLWVNGANFTSADQIQLGDDVLIKGKLRKYSSYKELDQNNEVISYKLKARLAWSEESYEADLSSSNTYPSLTNTNGVSVSYSSSNTDAATINPSTGAISLVAVGSTTIKAAFTGNETYKANEVSYTLNVSNSVLRADISFEENGGSTVTDLTEQSNLPDPLPTITKAGYNFGGWWTTSDFQAGTEAVAGAAVESTDDIVLYAKWLYPYTVTEALTMIDALADNGETGNVYVSGIVCTAPSNLISGGYLTYYISVDGTETNRLQVYKGKDENNVAFTDKDDVQKDDQVVVFGPLKKFKQGDNIIPEFNTGNYLYSLSRKEEAGIEWGVASFDAYIGQSNTFPTLTNPNSLTVAYSSSNEIAATIDPATGAIALGTTPNVNTTITASFAGNAGYKEAEVSYTLNVYNPTNPGKITYEENGGSEVADVTTPVDNFPNPLPEPTKENNIFAGWWTTSTFDDGTQAVAGAPMDGDVILFAKWTEIPVWARTYTSNVTLSTEGGTSASAAKVKFYGEEGDGYDAIKAGTGSAQGAVVVNVPAGATALHFHAYGWTSESVGLTVTAPTGVTVSPATEISINSNSGIANNSPFTLAEGSDPKTDAYYAVSLSGNTEATNITISATSGKRFVLFGVNQEGGVVPELQSIAISGDLDNKSYKAGQALDMTGLTVSATYTLGGTPQTPVDITNDPGLTWTYDPLEENQTEVTVTAHFGDPEKTASKTIEGLTVTSADPKIYVSTLNVNFASVEVGESVPAVETVTVTLTNVASVTATLGGTNADAFSVSPASLTESGDITISILANTDAAASYAATLTISDGEGGADDKTVNLSFEVTDPVTPEDPEVRKTWDLSIASYDANPTEDQVTWSATYVNMVADKANSTTAANNYLGGDANNRTSSRFYKNSTLTITPNAKEITSVVFTATSTSYANALQGSEWTNASASVDGTTVTVTPTEGKIAISAAIGGTCGFTAVQVNYKNITPEPPTPSYGSYERNGLTIGNYATICLPNGGTIANAKLYDLEYYDGASTLYLLEVTGNAMVAGRPYIFLPSETSIEVTYTDDANEPAGSFNGLVGSYSQTEIDANAENYILYQNAYYLVNSTAYVGENRAYIHMAGVPTTPTPQLGAAPRRRVAMTVNGTNTATDIYAINASEKPMKLIIDGQIYILRGEKMYDVTGKLLK